MAHPSYIVVAIDDGNIVGFNHVGNHCPIKSSKSEKYFNNCVFYASKYNEETFIAKVIRTIEFINGVRKQKIEIQSLYNCNGEPVSY